MAGSLRNVETPVSVIVPCFNNASLLAKCVASVQRGTPPNQIIIVDDCSTDGSLAVALELARRHDNIHVVARPVNGGAAAARFSALGSVRNSWIAFVDADDFLEENAIPHAYTTAQREMTDICIWEMWRYDSGRTWPNVCLKSKDFPKSGRLAVIETLGAWKIHPLGVAKLSLYETAYANFHETMINADELITRLMFAHASSVSLCSSKYYYRVNHESSTRSLSTRRLSSLDSYTWLLKFIKDYPEVEPSVIGMDGVAQAWYFMRHRHEFGTAQVLHRLANFLPQFAAAANLTHWIWRHPKHLAAFAIMRLMTFRHKNGCER